MPTKRATQAKDREQSRQEHRSRTNDPQHPRNVETPIGEFADTQSPFDIGINNFPDDGLLTTQPAVKPFWDRSAIIAVSVAMLTGAVIGVPIGRYLHRLLS